MVYKRWLYFHLKWIICAFIDAPIPTECGFTLKKILGKFCLQDYFYLNNTCGPEVIIFSIQDSIWGLDELSVSLNVFKVNNKNTSTRCEICLS